MVDLLSAWFAGELDRDHLVWEHPVWWWGRVGKLAQLLGAAGVVVDLIGRTRWEAFVAGLRPRLVKLKASLGVARESQRTKDVAGLASVFLVVALLWGLFHGYMPLWVSAVFAALLFVLLAAGVFTGTPLLLVILIPFFLLRLLWYALLKFALFMSRGILWVLNYDNARRALGVAAFALIVFGTGLDMMAS